MPLTGKPKGFTTSFQNHRLITEFQLDLSKLEKISFANLKVSVPDRLKSVLPVHLLRTCID